MLLSLSLLMDISHILTFDLGPLRYMFIFSPLQNHLYHGHFSHAKVKVINLCYILCFGVLKNIHQREITECKFLAANMAQMGLGTENDAYRQDQSNLWEVWAEDLMRKTVKDC